jgi:hypothetical protein
VSDASPKTVRPNSQKGRQLARLERDWPAWTPAYALRNPDDKAEILQQNARLWELKHVHGYQIENREEWRDGVCHSSYRLKRDQVSAPGTHNQRAEATSISRTTKAAELSLFSGTELERTARWEDHG